MNTPDAYIKSMAETGRKILDEVVRFKF